MQQTLFMAERFDGLDSDGVASRQQACKQSAKSEERSGSEQTSHSKRDLHPVGDGSAEKGVTGKTNGDTSSRTD
jgi:hypothetical protein